MPWARVVVLLLFSPQGVISATVSDKQESASSTAAESSQASPPAVLSASRTAPGSAEVRVAAELGAVVSQPAAADPAAANPATANPPVSSKEPEPAQLGSSDLSGLELPQRGMPPLREVSPVQRRLWYSLVFTSHTAAVFDAWASRRAITQGGATELNPVLRPFSHSNALYAATQASPVLMDFLGHRFMTSGHPWLRRIWWLPQGAGTVMSVATGARGLSLVR